MALLDDLKKATSREYKMWKWSARLYSSISRGLQIAIIFASTAVVGGKTLERFLGPTEEWVPLLTLVIGAFTAVNFWLRPTQKWQGFLNDRDKLDGLCMRVRNADNKDEATIEQYADKFTELRLSHNERNVN